MVMALCLGTIILPKPQFERARVRSPPSSTFLLDIFFKIVVGNSSWMVGLGVFGIWVLGWGLGGEWCGFLGWGGVGGSSQGCLMAGGVWRNAV